MFEEIFDYDSIELDQEDSLIMFCNCQLQIELDMMVHRPNPIPLRIFKPGHMFAFASFDLINDTLNLYETSGDFGDDNATITIPVGIILKPDWDVEIGNTIVKKD